MEKSSEPAKPETANRQPTTEDMEVHKHPHRVTHKKKWGEYLLEFLMLFLAVFLGFFAENFREHQVEKERGRQYIRSFYEDLKTDTAREAFIIKFDEDKILGLSDMSACYDSLFKNPAASACMEKLIQSSRNNRAFSIANRTIGQLANAGGFRILNREDADSILEYENLFKNYQNFESTVFQDAQDNVRSTLSRLVNFKVNQALQPQGIDRTKIEQAGTLLFSNNKDLLNEWFNELSLYDRVLNSQRNLLGELENKAASLLKYFKNKYHLE